MAILLQSLCVCVCMPNEQRNKSGCCESRKWIFTNRDESFTQTDVRNYIEME